jgi:hypothetical protein
MVTRHRCRLAAIVAVLAVLSACALPPPGAFVEVAEVRASEIPVSRPVKEVPVAWDALLHGTAPVQDCGPETCAPDPGAWLERCVEPRAMAMAAAARRQLLASHQWHASALASIRAPRPEVSLPPPGSCDGNLLVQETAMRIVRAAGALAASDAVAACPALRLRALKFSLNEIDRSKESFSEWLRNDYPTVVGSTFAGIFTGAVLMPIGDIISRIAKMELKFTVADGDNEQSMLTLDVRGSASLKLASGKVLERSRTPPPELVPVAFAAAIGELDRELQTFVEAGCRPVHRP